MKINDVLNLKIEKLNNRGLGIAYNLGKKILVNYTLPGEEIEAKITKINSKIILADLVKKISVSENRIEPICKHFTLCGGCSLQHLNNQLYRDYKISLLNDALKYSNLYPETIKPAVFIEPYSRRRVTFQVKNDEIGFYSISSHNFVKLDVCHIVLPEILILAQSLKSLIRNLQLEQIIISVINDTKEIILVGKKILDINNKQKIVAFSKDNNINRIYFQNDDNLDIICQNTPLYFEYNNTKIELPPASFMQATKQALDQIIQDIIPEVKDRKNAVDLYSGCGVYSLAVSPFIRVTAVEGNEIMVKNLNKAIANHNLVSITTLRKDLFNSPLLSNELTKYDLAIINPPRNGALPQVEELAKARIKKIIMISCNLESFVRDAIELKNKDYKLKSIKMIDQFVWTHHIEIVAIFEL